MNPSAPAPTRSTRILSLQTLGMALMLAALTGVASAQLLRDELPFTDGPINVALRTGGSLIVGGSFSYIGPATGYAAPLDVASGTAAANLHVKGGSVNTVVSDGAGGWFIGGDFTSVLGSPRLGLAHVLADHTLGVMDVPTTGVLTLVRSGPTLYVGGSFLTIGGETRNKLAAVDIGTGSLTAWNPDMGADVGHYRPEIRTIAVSGSTVYAGGTFSQAGGQSRQNLAAVNATTGLATSFTADTPLDQPVQALVVSGTTLYVGGYFTSLGGTPRSYLAAVDATTGALSDWNPASNGAVGQLIVDGSSLYVRGGFSMIGGQSRSQLAAIDVSTASATSWNPSANGGVYAMALSGSTVYLGGDFSVVDGQPRLRTAAVDATNGQVISWTSSANRAVLALDVAGTEVMAGGTFGSIGGRLRNNLAEVDAATGVIAPWAPSPNGAVLALAASGSTIYAGGGFTSIGGQGRNFIAALDGSTGLATSWNPDPDASVYALAATPSAVYAGGFFTRMSNKARNHLAAINTANDKATIWDPNADGQVAGIVIDGSTVYAYGLFATIGGVARSGLASMDATTGTVSPTWMPNPNGGTYALAIRGSTVYVGGSFTVIGGAPRNRIAAVDATNGTPTAWNPGSSESVGALALDTDVIYAGNAYAGGPFTIGGQTRPGGAAVDLGTGLATSWVGPFIGGVKQLLNDGTTLFAVGDPAAAVDGSHVYLAGVGLAGPADVEPGRVSGVELLTAWPNPTTGPIRFAYALPSAAVVRISLLDLQGREVARFVDGSQTAGRHDVIWHARAGAHTLASGLYFMRMDANGEIRMRRLVVEH